MTLELVIVGGGPAGLAAAHAAQRCGLSYLVLEQARVAQTIEDYPRRKPLHSPPQDLELAWGELYSQQQPNATREELLAHYAKFIGARGLAVRDGECVRSIERSAEGFTLRARETTHAARKVLVATGGFGVPRRLGVPGETPERVSYRFVEGAPYAGREVLVVGGGNSAAEAALWLHEAGARVTLSLRRRTFAPRDGVSDAFTSVKPFNIRALEALASRGGLRVLFSSSLVEITPQAARLWTRDGSSLRVACHHVFALIGADPDVSLLRQAGAAIAADGRPVYDPETFETTQPGLFVAGHVTRELHIPKTLVTVPRIVRRIAGERPSARGASLAALALATALKKARARSGLIRRAVRDFALLRRLVQAIDHADGMRDKRLSRLRNFIRRYPRVHRMVRALAPQ